MGVCNFNANVSRLTTPTSLAIMNVCRCYPAERSEDHPGCIFSRDEKTSFAVDGDPYAEV